MFSLKIPSMWTGRRAPIPPAEPGEGERTGGRKADGTSLPTILCGIPAELLGHAPRPTARSSPLPLATSSRRRTADRGQLRCAGAANLKHTPWRFGLRRRHVFVNRSPPPDGCAPDNLTKFQTLELHDHLVLVRVPCPRKLKRTDPGMTTESVGAE